MMNLDEYLLTGGGGDSLGLALGNNPGLGLVDELGLGLNNLYLDDFSGVDWSNDFSNNLPLQLAGAESAFGFNEDFVQLPFLGDLQQGFGGLEEFGPELGQQFLQDFQAESESDHHRSRRDRRHRDKRGKRDKKRRDGPRADGPGYYRDDTPQRDGPPPDAPPPPAVSPSTACSRSDVRGPEAGGPPPDADEVASSASSHSSSSSSSSSSSDTPVPPEPQQPPRGRSKDRTCSKKDLRVDPRSRDHQAPRKSSHRRRRTPDDFYRVEQARRISPNRDPPSYDTYQRFYRRNRSVSPGESVSTRSSSADSASTVSTRAGNSDGIRRSKLYKAARKCTADYLTRVKIQAPYDRPSGPWVTAVSDVFVRMGFTIVDCVLEKHGGIITILSPPQLVGMEIGNLPWEVQTAITSIRAARVCRKNGKYDLQVW